MPPLIPLIHLIVQYCNARRADRQAEYDYCLRRNLNNPAIKLVHNLVEPGVVVPEEFRNHPKYIERTLPRWMTYQDAIAYANERLVGEVVCIANSDIFLDDGGSNWWSVDGIVRDNVVLCLSRIEFAPPGLTYKDPALVNMAFANSQDAWLFEAPIVVPDCDFEIGTMGCDNAIAERFKRAGRTPVNSPNQFKIFHYDVCRGKTAANATDIHAKERAGRPAKHPEEQGQYLVPDIDQVKSVDGLLKSLGVSDFQKYQVICDVLNRFMKIKNRPAERPASRERSPREMPRVAFFNHWHNGDIYLSRGIIEDVMRQFPEKQFFCSHGCAPDLLCDIDGLTFDRSLLDRIAVETMKAPFVVDDVTDTLFINTWIGLHGDDRVHQRGGSTVQLLREYLAPGLRAALGMELGPATEYLPEPKWEKFSIAGVNEFAKQDRRKKVLICNGTIRSNQSAHFDFAPMIERLAAAFPDILFVPTNATGIKRANVLHSPEIIRKSGSDLNENGYLSTFCDVIVGRSSGAYTFCLNRTNVQSVKAFVAFTVRPAETALGFDDPVFEPKCKFLWSGEFREEAIYEVMRKAVAGE